MLEKKLRKHLHQRLLQQLLISSIDVKEAGSLAFNLSVTAGKLTLPTTTGLTFIVGDGVNDASMEFRASTLTVLNAALNGSGVWRSVSHHSLISTIFQSKESKSKTSI
jgi:hypothetical protein